MFKGASKLFSTKKPPFILFELLGKSFSRTKCSLDLLLSLRKLGYTIKTVDDMLEWNDNRIEVFIYDYSASTAINQIKLDIVLELEKLSMMRY